MSKIIIALALAITSFTAVAAAKLPPKPPVIVSTQCSSTGCWIHFADGTSRWASAK